jgi:hypothetical protein
MADTAILHRRADGAARFDVRSEFTTALRGNGYGKLSDSLCACGNKEVCRLTAD